MASRRMRILVVDDRMNWREAMQAVLSTTYEVTASAGLRSARNLLAKKKFDLVVLDVRLANEAEDVSGITLFTEIKEKYMGTLVVFLTGYDEELTKMRLGGHKPDAVLRKPILDCMEFNRVVSRLIRHRKV